MGAGTGWAREGEDAGEGTQERERGKERDRDRERERDRLGFLAGDQKLIGIVGTYQHLSQ